MKHGHTRTVKKDSRFSRVAGWVMIFCATFVAYLPAFNGDLLWDDSAHLTAPALRSFQGLWRIWRNVGTTQQYYPLLHSAFWLEHRLWGDAVVGYHLTNIALHAVSACLVVMIVRRLSLPGAWLAGFIFALHPVFVEGVAWISEQKSTLSGVFCLASLLTYLYFDQTRRKSTYLLATGLFVLALLSKTVTAMLPAVLVVIFWWQRGRLAWKRDLLPLLPWFALSTSAGLFTAWMERTLIGARGAAFMLTPAQRVLIASRAIFFYAGKLFWPINLTFSYPHWQVNPTVWWQWLFPAGVLALAISLAFAARRYRGPLAGFLIFAGTLFPVLGFLNVYPFRYSYVADHFQYLASLGIIVPVTSALTMLVERSSSGKMVTIALSAVVIGVLTWRQSGAYRNVETLYGETIARNPASFLAHNNLGVVLLEQPGQLEEAITEFQAALRIEPDYPEAHNNLGLALSRVRGRLPEAIAEYQAAVRIKSDYAPAHTNLGSALLQIPGRLPEAITECQAALRVSPEDADAHNNLGSALARVPGRLPEAIAEYQAALRIKPDYAEVHNNLASALAHTPGRLQEAIAEYQEALRIKPDYAEAHYNLGNTLAQIPARLPEAVDEYRAALRIRPDLAELHYNLALTLAQLPGRLPEAITEFQAVLLIRPDYKPALQSIEQLRRVQK